MSAFFFERHLYKCHVYSEYRDVREEHVLFDSVLRVPNSLKLRIIILCY